MRFNPVRLLHALCATHAVRPSRAVGKHNRALPLAVLFALAAGCAPETPPSATTAPQSVVPQPGSTGDAAPTDDPSSLRPSGGTALISAAASTKDLLEAVIAEFNKSSAAEIKLNTGSSSGLANQIIAGAPADLFLSASTQWADEVDKAGLVEDQVQLLTNRLALVVPEGNPAAVSRPEDLLSDTVQKVALAGESVPAGMYADQALAKLNLLAPLSESGKIVRGQDVRTALSYVERGEAEAGVVYSTDVGAASGVTAVSEFDPALHDPIVYVLVRLKNGATNSAAIEFYRYLQSGDADSVYDRFGFTRIRLEHASDPADAARPGDTEIGP